MVFVFTCAQSPGFQIRFMSKCSHNMSRYSHKKLGAPSPNTFVIYRFCWLAILRKLDWLQILSLCLSHSLSLCSLYMSLGWTFSFRPYTHLQQKVIYSLVLDAPVVDSVSQHQCICMRLRWKGGKNTFTGLHRNATNLTVPNSATPAELFCVLSIKAVLHYLYLIGSFLYFSPDASRKKSKKKRRKLRDIERSSGDSDNQTSNDDMARKSHIMSNEKADSDNSQSGVDADSESQGSRDFKKVVGEDQDQDGSEAQVSVRWRKLNVM